MNKVQLLYPELSYKIVGICFNAQNELGRFSREKQYGDFIEKELKNETLIYKRELIIPESKDIIDFLIENKIVLELKAKSFITKLDYYQVQRYLQHGNLDLGLIVNFRTKTLQPKRILRTSKAIK